MTLFLMVFWPLILIAAAVYIWLHARILKKAGFSRLWSLLMILPPVNIVMIWVFAFADWPALKKPQDISEIFD